MRASMIMAVCAILFSLAADAPTGEIKGKITTNNVNEPVSFASVKAYRETALISSSTAGQDGRYELPKLSPGKYILKISCVGFQPQEIRNVVVKANQVTTVDMKMKKGADLKKVEVVEYKTPAPDMKRESEIVIMHDSKEKKDLNSVIQFSPGVSSNYSVTQKGSRQNGTVSYQWQDPVIRCSRNLPPDENTEEYEYMIENPYFDVKSRPLSTFSIDVDAASYSNIRRFINEGTLPPSDAVRIEEMINYFSYSYQQPTDGSPFAIHTEVSSCPWNAKHRLVKIGLSGKAVEQENLPENNLVFLIDVSGSMNQPNKLPLLKSSFHLLVDQLRKQDRVAIVVYAGNAGLVLPSTRGNEKEKIMAAIDELEAGGSTAGGAGIQLAYKIAKENFNTEGNNRVILATDGDFNVGVSSDADLVHLIEAKRAEGVFLTVLGFGTGNYKDAKMEKLADKGNGNFAYVDNIMEANKVLVKEMGATLNTIAKDVKLQIEFNPAKVKSYRLIGYENRVLQDQDFNDDKKDAGELGSGKTVTALYELIPAGSEEEENKIDPLKYQSTTHASTASGNELMTVKFRYKDPNGTKSKLLVHPLIDTNTGIGNSSIDLRFAAAVAEFGMLLRDSKFKGASNYKNVLALARESKGIDTEGYRAEFIRLVETADLLSRGTAQKDSK